MKILFIILGSISLGLGILGIFLPMLPTTPFLLLAASLYFRSSKKLYNKLINHPTLGTYIVNFREKNAIPLKVKIISISLMWISLLNCMYFVTDSWLVRLILLLIGIGVTIHITRYKTLDD